MSNKASSQADITIKQPYRSPTMGRSLKLIAFLMVVLGAAGIPAIGGSLDGFGWLVAIAVMLAGGGLFYFSSRLGAISATDLLANDHRPPLVFIRSFHDEQADYTLSGYTKSLKSVSKEPGFTDNNVWGPGFQYQLNTLLDSIGPYIAIGRPGEDLAGIGAARIYVGDDEWQDVILRYFADSRLIIMRAGKTEGLSWELKQLVKQGKSKTVLLILPHTQEDYQAFCYWANKVLPKPLPTEKPDARFMCFSEGWMAKPLAPQRFLFSTLEPFFNQNGIRRQDIRLSYFLQYDSWLNYLLGFVVLVVAGVVIYWVYQWL